MTSGPEPRRVAADLLVECLEAEGCDYVFSVPGEETMDILDALSRRPSVRNITTRHEQGAAFMADVHGRLTGRAAVALATLGPGATNLITGVADAYLDRAPMVAITGQASSDKLHKEAHQVVDIVRMMEPVTKWNTRVERVEAIPEIVRKAFRLATLEKPGPTHIELPENLAAMTVSGADVGGPVPLTPGRTYFPEPTEDAIAHAAGLLAAAERPIVLAGNGVLRRGAAGSLRELARGLHIPVATTFMGKGAMDDRSHLSLMAVGLQARDHVLSGFDRADLVLCVGYDLVEYAPSSWNGSDPKRIVHIDTQPAETDAAYQPEVELVGDIDGTLRRLLTAVLPHGVGGRDAGERHASKEILVHADLRTQLLAELGAHEADDAWPITPQRAIADLRRALAPEDIVVSDVGAHKVWVARMYQAYEPNTVIISNGFAAMGISVPGAIAAKLVHPERKVVALCGDGGFLMNSQELETAKRIGANITVVVWRDDGYGLIDWKQRNEYGRPFGVEFGNPDFVAYAQSFGIAGFRPSSADDLYPVLMRALETDGPALVEVPIDYAENLRLTERLGHSPAAAEGTQQAASLGSTSGGKDMTDGPGPTARVVHEMRIAMTVAQYEEAVTFYRDALGLREVESWDRPDGRGTILDAGHATLELFDPRMAESLDAIEVGRRVSGTIRFALEVEDSIATAERLIDHGATREAEMVVTSWRDQNVRVRAPDGMQLTLFTHLGSE